jgi:hypothetical protein
VAIRGRVSWFGYVWICPSRVNRVILVVGRLLPVFPWKRTSSGSVAMSQRCQQRKSRSIRSPHCADKRLAPISFRQAGSPQSFFHSREAFGAPRARHVSVSRNT